MAGRSVKDWHTGGPDMTRKGKSRSRQARVDIMRRNEANARRKARRQQAGRGYDRQAYDGNTSEPGESWMSHRSEGGGKRTN